MCILKTIKQCIIDELVDCLERSTSTNPGSNLEMDLVLLDSGLDSLGFAVLVTRLEQTLGYDPFTLDPNPVYPVTLGDFIDMYERYSENRKIQ